MSFPNGDKRRTRGFKKKSGEGGALAFADLKRGEIATDGTRHEAISDDERRAVIAFRDLVSSLPDSAKKPTLADAIALLRDHQKIRNKSKTVREILDSYLKKLERKQLSDSYVYTITNRLERFSGDHTDWLACDVSTEVAEDWLEDLGLGVQSFNHYRTALVQLFGYAENLGAVEQNPIAAVSKKKIGGREVGILTLDEVKGLLQHAPAEILPGLALGLFTGVRRAELCRMDWSEIDFEQGLVHVAASKSKTAARRLIPLRPALKSLLELHRKGKGAIMPSEMIYRTRLKTTLDAAKIKHWPHNALRHSFASYHLAHFKDAGALALEMGHESTRMIFEHYRALVTPKEGANFWRHSEI